MNKIIKEETRGAGNPIWENVWHVGLLGRTTGHISVRA